MKNSDCLIQFQKQLGIIDEGEVVSDDDYEQSLEVSDEEIRRKQNNE